MTEDDKKTGAPRSGAKQQARAEALRENLLKRKQQTRARAAQETAPHSQTDNHKKEK